MPDKNAPAKVDQKTGAAPQVKWDDSAMKASTVARSLLPNQPDLQAHPVLAMPPLRARPGSC